MRYDSLPSELTDIPQWVCVWNSSKIPMQSASRLAASSSEPSTWSDFATAKQAVSSGKYDHVGFVFNNNGIVGIDIDRGFDQNGFLSKLSIDIMSHCRSYTEKSRSGRGIHVLLKGKLPFRGRNNGSGVEIYQSGRYFIMTGETLVFPEIIENQEAIDYIVQTYFPGTVSNMTDRPLNRIYSPVYLPPQDGKVFLRPDYPPIVDGSRNNSMASLAGQLHTLGYQKEDIYKEICYANQTACHPPLPDREIMAIVNSITRYRR